MAKHAHPHPQTPSGKYSPRRKQGWPLKQPRLGSIFQHRPAGLSVLVDPQTMVKLQSTIGNAAVQRLLQTRRQSSTISIPILQREPPTAVTAPTRPKPAWASDRKQIRTIQKYLRRIGTYRYSVDGKYGPYTDSALVEAFGGDSFRTLDYATTLARVKAARHLSGKRGQRMLRYGEMFRDGVLDITIGVGHDERGGDIMKLAGIHTILEDKGFKKDDAKAQKLYKQAGRPFVKGEAYIHFVKENALIYTPPAGTPRPIHIVIRIISNTQNLHGAKAAKAFLEGMARSDITYYTGHGRYGSGADFDRNFESFTLLDQHGKLEALFLDYNALHKFLKKEGRRHRRSAWRQFLWREKRGRIKVKLRNEGNIFINPKNYHPYEFGARLIYWALKKGGAKLATGPSGAISQEMKKAGAQRYRIVVFAGCRTKDYHRMLRGTPGLGTKTAHLLETTKTIKTADAAQIFGAFLESLLGQFSANAIVKAMDINQDVQKRVKGAKYLRGTFRSRGTKYDPVVR